MPFLGRVVATNKTTGHATCTIDEPLPTRAECRRRPFAGDELPRLRQVGLPLGNVGEGMVMANEQPTSVIVDYGHGVLVRLTGCVVRPAAQPSDERPRSRLTTPEKLRRMLYGS